MAEQKLHILVVDDEKAIRHFLNTALSAQQYVVHEARTGQEALAAVAANPPDVMILDLGLPDLDGTEVVRQLRVWTQLPIIILSVREHERDKIAALDAGADDYLTKPFGVGELSARLRAALRHASQAAGEPRFQTGQLLVDFARRVVQIDGQEVQLTPTEYGLLGELAAHAGKVLTHRHLLHTVWGAEYSGETHLLRVNISNLRRKIEPDSTRPRYVLTEPGVGYRLKVEN
jgi:two-component system KDP operon response regulator KdpE